MNSRNNRHQVFYRILNAVLNISSLIVFLVLFIGLTALVLLDIAVQFTGGPLYTIIVGVAFLAICSIATYMSRIYVNRSVLFDIPKTYMPINTDDTPAVPWAHIARI